MASASGALEVWVASLEEGWEDLVQDLELLEVLVEDLVEDLVVVLVEGLEDLVGG